MLAREFDGTIALMYSNCQNASVDVVFGASAFRHVYTEQLNMRVPPAMKAVTGRLARQRTTDNTTLARIWLAERIQEEL